MPLYMDRHYIPGASAKAVAEAHQLDLNNQTKYNCKTLTYWFDKDKGLAFCLVEAPNKTAVEELHRNSHGLIPNQIIEVGGEIVELFLGRISDPENIKHLEEFESFINESATRTIMRVNLEYKAPLKLNNKQSEQNLIERITRDKIKIYNGQEVSSDRDGLMASFTSVSNAGKCAIDILAEINTKTINISEGGYGVSISLSVGNPVSDQENFFGDTIQMANLLCHIANINQIVCSYTVAEILAEEFENNSTNFKTKFLNGSEEKFLTQFMELIEEVWNDENFKIDDFSKQIGLSKAQLYRKVKSLTGSSLNEFIRNYRLKKALKLLDEKNKNISEIAFETGFNNASYFSKCFQSKFGIRPSEYIKV